MQILMRLNDIIYMTKFKIIVMKCPLKSQKDYKYILFFWLSKIVC
jgi:hypothetical protein